MVCKRQVSLCCILAHSAENPAPVQFCERRLEENRNKKNGTPIGVPLNFLERGTRFEPATSTLANGNPTEESLLAWEKSFAKSRLVWSKLAGRPSY